MYDPKMNGGTDWHDLTALQKCNFLVQENTWLAGVISAQIGQVTTHEQNLQMARKFVSLQYPRLWEMAHGNSVCCDWPKQADLQKKVRQFFGLSFFEFPQ